MLGHALQHGEVVVVAFVPAFDRAAGQAQGGEGYDPVRVEGFAIAQSIAGLAGAHGRVEREQAWLQLGQGVVAEGAGELGAEQMFAASVHLQGDHAAAGIGAAGTQGGLEAFGQALLDVLAHLDAVYHHIDVVALVLFQFGQ